MSFYSSRNTRPLSSQPGSNIHTIHDLPKDQDDEISHITQSMLYQSQEMAQKIEQQTREIEQQKQNIQEKTISFNDRLRANNANLQSIENRLIENQYTTSSLLKTFISAASIAAGIATGVLGVSYFYKRTDKIEEF